MYVLFFIAITAGTVLSQCSNLGILFLSFLLFFFITLIFFFFTVSYDT
jgi:hypothetical protein